MAYIIGVGLRMLLKDGCHFSCQFFCPALRLLVVLLCIQRARGRSNSCATHVAKDITPQAVDFNEQELCKRTRGISRFVQIRRRRMESSGSCLGKRQSSGAFS